MKQFIFVHYCINFGKSNFQQTFDFYDFIYSYKQPFEYLNHHLKRSSLCIIESEFVNIQEGTPNLWEIRNQTLTILSTEFIFIDLLRKSKWPITTGANLNFNEWKFTYLFNKPYLFLKWE